MCDRRAVWFAEIIKCLCRPFCFTNIFYHISRLLMWIHIGWRATFVVRFDDKCQLSYFLDTDDFYILNGAECVGSKSILYTRNLRMNSVLSLDLKCHSKCFYGLTLLIKRNLNRCTMPFSRKNFEFIAVSLVTILYSLFWFLYLITLLS